MSRGLGDVYKRQGAKNAAYLALQIIGVQHKEVQEKLLAERKQMEESAMKANEEVIAKYN